LVAEVVDQKNREDFEKLIREGEFFDKKYGVQLLDVLSQYGWKLRLAHKETEEDNLGKTNLWS
jgi:hypothetical protein